MLMYHCAPDLHWPFDTEINVVNIQLKQLQVNVSEKFVIRKKIQEFDILEEKTEKSD